MAFISDHAAFTGIDEKKWRMYWQGRFRRGRPYLHEEKQFERHHTVEIQELRRFLGLREAQLPCLTFTLLNRDPSPLSLLGPQTINLITVLFSSFENSTIYHYLKALSEELEDEFREIDRFRSEIVALQREKLQSEKRPLELCRLRKSVRANLHELDTPEAQDAVIRILNLTGVSDRTVESRSDCFRLLQAVRGESPFRRGFFRELQRLIDFSFSEWALPLSFDERDFYEGEDDLRLRLSRLSGDENDAWSRLYLALQQFCEARRNSVDSEHWDFFIAYSSCDRRIAELACSKLSQIGRAFLDSRYLKPGDRWPERIRAAQDNSRSTVLIITGQTPNSWFVESEYLHAIELVRHGQHVIIPVLYGRDARLPYGLEQVHAITLQSWKDLDRLPELLRHIGEDKTAPSVSG